MNKTTAKLRKCDERYLQNKLSEALGSLEKFLQPYNKGCSVDHKSRKNSQLYLNSWVSRPLKDLFLWAHGEGREPRFLNESEDLRRRKRIKELLK